MVALRRPDQLPDPPDDGRPVRTVASYSWQKTHYWCKYAEAASTAIKDKFDFRACIDLFSASGICKNRETHELSWGSALLALQVTSPFDLYVFNDISGRAAETLAARVEDLGVPGATVFRIDLDDTSALRDARAVAAVGALGPKVVVIRGDANKAPLFVRALIPNAGRRYLLSLVDPPRACFEWRSFEGISFGPWAFDALVLFPDAMDFQRSISYALHNPDSRVATRFTAYFGTSTWRDVALSNPKHAESELHRLYESQMRKLLSLRLGHAKPVGATRRPMYHLVFGSKSQFGVDLWNRVNRRTPAEQDELFLGA